MALSNLTKVQTVGIGSNIEVVGVVTTGQFKSGTSNLHSTGVELTNLNVSGIATIGGNLSIGGTLTYEDVTNIDSIGIVTARAGVNVSGGQLDVGSNIKLGNAGVITATSFVGSGANLTGVTALSGSTNNTVCTVTGANAIQGEANLTFDGTQLSVTGSGTDVLKITSTNAGDTGANLLLHHNSASPADNDIIGVISFRGEDDSGAETTFSELRVISTDVSNNSESGDITFHTRSAGTFGERLRITSDGKVVINKNSGDFDGALHVKAISEDAITIEGSNAAINWRYTDGSAGYRGGIKWHSNGLVKFDAGVSGNSYYYAFHLNAAERLRIAANGKIGINNNSPAHPLHIVNTSSTFNSASLIKGDTSTSGGGAYATFTNTANSKSAYFGLDGNGLFNLDAGTALVGTSGDESIIFATNGNDEKVRIFGGTDNVLQIKGGNNLTITDYSPNQNFSGTYAGYFVDNHGNQLIGINAHLNYSGTSGTHQWKQTNAHGSIGSAGMFIGGNGSDNNTAITFFRNGQGSSAGTVFSQDSYKFRISDELVTNYNIRHQMRGFFRTNTNSQNASNGPQLATGQGYGFGYQEAYSTSGGTWVHPYPDLVLGYHTGVSLGGYPNYGGCRFFTDHPSSSTTMIFSVGNGNNGVAVVNSLSKGGGSFRIAHPHPSKKYTHDLQHSFIEGPQCDNIYRGKIDLVAGSASINIDTVSSMTDGTFVLLNRDIQCFTSNETGWTAVKGSVSGNILTITAQDNSCTDTISWMVIGERQDDKIKSPQMEMTDSDGKLIVEPLTIEESHM